MVVSACAGGSDHHITLAFSELISGTCAQQIDAGTRVNGGIAADVQAAIAGIGRYNSVLARQVGDARDQRRGGFLVVIPGNRNVRVHLQRRATVLHGRRIHVVVQHQRTGTKDDV
ncbi:hypothetical protein D3C71_836020 [compost metagenome]